MAALPTACPWAHLLLISPFLWAVPISVSFILMSQECHMSSWQRDNESTQSYWLERKYWALISNIHVAEEWGTSQELVTFQKDDIVKRPKQFSQLLESLETTDRDVLFSGVLMSWIILELEQILLDICGYKSHHDSMSQSGLSVSTSCQVFSNIWIFTISVQFLLGLKTLLLERSILTWCLLLIKFWLGLCS